VLGAGFSRNYGGRLAAELTADLMGPVSDGAELLKQLRQQHGFEAAAVTALG
jgi:CheY-like chemotaxis protein